MGKDVTYVLKRGTQLAEEEIAMIEAASMMPEEYDEDNPEIDPVKTPELYKSLIKAVGERNRRISKRRA